VKETLKAPAPAPVKEAPRPAAPVREETILAAKPGVQAPKQPQRRPERAPRRDATLHKGDELLIGKPHRASPRPETPTIPAAADDERAAQIVKFLSGLMAHLNVQAVPEVFVAGEDNYKVILQGESLGALIGRRGETLDAIQQLTNYSVNNGQSKRVRIHIDAEGYRAKREQSLRHLAEKVAGKVVKYRKSMTLEPMNAYERHVIHAALQDVPNVSTYSTGVEPNRRTVVVYSPGQK
jgi:spoIIIJ-associated protein